MTSEGLVATSQRADKEYSTVIFQCLGSVPMLMSNLGGPCCALSPNVLFRKRTLHGATPPRAQDYCNVEGSPGRSRVGPVHRPAQR
jgi:hypothetical protein